MLHIHGAGEIPLHYLSVRKSTPLQTAENTMIILSLKYKNKFTSMFANALTFTNTNDIIRTD